MFAAFLSALSLPKCEKFCSGACFDEYSICGGYFPLVSAPAPRTEARPSEGLAPSRPAASPGPGHRPEPRPAPQAPFRAVTLGKFGAQTLRGAAPPCDSCLKGRIAVLPPSSRVSAGSSGAAFLSLSLQQRDHFPRGASVGSLVPVPSVSGPSPGAGHALGCWTPAWRPEAFRFPSVFGSRQPLPRFRASQRRFVLSC